MTQSTVHRHRHAVNVTCGACGGNRTDEFGAACPECRGRGFRRDLTVGSRLAGDLAGAADLGELLSLLDEHAARTDHHGDVLRSNYLAYQADVFSAEAATTRTIAAAVRAVTGGPDRPRPAAVARKFFRRVA